MRRFLTIISVLFFSIQFLGAQTISVSSNMPKNAVAGQKLRVILTIEKNNLNGFAKYTQPLPAGFVALEDSGQNAEFRFENNILELVWLFLPKENSFTTSYTLQIADTLKGTFSFESEFSYIYKNKIASTSLPKHFLKVLTINEFLAKGGQESDLKNLVIVPEQKVQPSVKIYRTKKDTLKGKLIVEINIQNQNHTQSAQLLEGIPEACNIAILDSAKADITVDNNLLKVNWDKLPLGKSQIRYLLTPKTNNPVILSDFQGALSLSNDKGEILYDVFEPENNFYVLQAPKNIVPNEMIAVKEKKSNNKNTQTTINKSLVASASNTALASKIVKSFKKGSTIHYRIQVAALSKAVPKSYFNKYSLNMPVNKEQHNGLYKYTIGDFKTYEQAKAFKDKLLKSTDLKNAFITAYKKENRIEVQKAIKKTGK